MKYVMVLVSAFTLAGIATAAPEAQPPSPRTISVSGSAVGYIPADAIVWDVTLQAAGKDLLEAKESIDQQVKNLVEACSKKGIQGPDVFLGFINIRDARLPGNTTAAEPGKPLNVTRIVTLRQKDPRLFGDVLEMLARGRNVKVEYKAVRSKAEQITRETTVKATLAAKDKATDMAGALGARLGNALNINEYPPPGWSIPDASIPIDENTKVYGADAEKVRMTVYVTFELQ